MSEHTRLQQVLKKVEIAHAFKMKKWEDKMDNMYQRVAEHISKLLLWGDTSPENVADWCESIAKHLEKLINGKVITDKGIRKLTKEEIKENVFDGKMYDFKEFQETLEDLIVTLKKKGYTLQEEPNYYKLWNKYCKVRDKLLTILTEVRGTNEEIKSMIQNTCKEFISRGK